MKPLELSERASFWAAAAVVVHTLWISAAPSLTYPLYAAEWNLTPFETTAIFAVYPIAVVAALMAFGQLSDRIGNRDTVLFGLLSSFIGTLLFAVAPDVSWVFAGRVFMGLGVGLTAGPAAAALVEYSGSDGTMFASAVTTIGQAVGIGVAALLGGALIQYAPLPTRLNFIVLLFVILLMGITTWFMPRRERKHIGSGWRMPRLHIPTGTRGVFPAAAVGATIAYVVGALILSLGAQTARDLIHSSNYLVNGISVAVYAIIWGISGVLGKRVRPAKALVIGSVVIIASMILLVLSTVLQSLVLFLPAVGAAGGASSLLVMGGLALISSTAAAGARGATLSFFFLIAYCLQGLAAFALGWLATAFGLKGAIDIASVAIIVMALLTTTLVRVFVVDDSELTIARAN